MSTIRFKGPRPRRLSPRRRIARSRSNKSPTSFTSFAVCEVRVKNIYGLTFCPVLTLDTPKRLGNSTPASNGVNPPSMSNLSTSS
jgi:hypothetical protein